MGSDDECEMPEHAIGICISMTLENVNATLIKCVNYV